MEILNKQKIDLVDVSKGFELCKILYDALSPAGIFPALTGGLLYKEGERKDIDIVLYRHRQANKGFECSDKDVLKILEDIGFYEIQCFGFVTKSKWKGSVVDLFNPETLIGIGDDYGK